MKTLSSLLLLAGALCAQNNRLTPEEKKQGWKLLFDGKSLKDWEAPGDAFSIDGDAIKSASKPRSRQDLFTRQRFGDFELAFDWRISPGGNSGVKYRIQDRIWVDEQPGKKFEDQVALAYRENRRTKPSGGGHEYVIGFEYQCIDNEKNADGRRGGSHSSGALYDMVAPATQAAKPVGEFNQSRVVVKGSHVEHWLNGVKVVDGELNSDAVKAGLAKRWGPGSKVYELLAGQPVKECPISLQNHNDEAWFRNIKVRRMR